MSDEARDQQGAEGQEAGGSGADSNARLSELEKKLAEQSKAINSLNSVNDRLTRALEEKQDEAERAKTEKLTDIEKLQAQLEQERSERQKWQREVAIKENTSKAKDFLHEKQIPADFVEFLNVSDSESMSQGLEKLSGLIEKIKSSFAEDFAKKNGQGAPKGGGGNFAGKTRKSDFSVQEATDYAKANGIDAWNALPK